MPVDTGAFGNDASEITLFGQPYHGLAFSQDGTARVVLPNGSVHDFGVPLTSGNTRLSQRPGWSAPSRDADGAARDALHGWQWPGWWLWGGVIPLSAGEWVYFGPDGAAWACSVDVATKELVILPFGRIPDSGIQERRLALTGDALPVDPLFQNSSAAGTRACFFFGAVFDLSEVTITAGDATGPTSASVVTSSRRLREDYTESIGYEHLESCPPDGGFVWGGGDLWSSVSKSLVSELVVAVDYVGETRVDTVARTSAAVNGTASNEAVCPVEWDADNEQWGLTGDCTLNRTVHITWAYSLVVVRSGVEVATGELTLTRDLVTEFLSPDPNALPGNYGYSRVTDNDNLTVADGVVWTGYFMAEWVDAWFLSNTPIIYEDVPSLKGTVGIGEYAVSHTLFGGPCPGGVCEETTVLLETYPYFHCTTIWKGAFSWSAEAEAYFYDAVTGPSLDGCLYISSGIDVDTLTCSGNWGGASIGLVIMSNNVASVRSVQKAPVEGSIAQTWYGPVVATAGYDAAVVAGNIHFCSYHPVTNEIARSSVSPICWV